MPAVLRFALPALAAAPFLLLVLWTYVNHAIVVFANRSDRGVVVELRDHDGPVRAAYVPVRSGVRFVYRGEGALWVSVRTAQPPPEAVIGYVTSFDSRTHRVIWDGQDLGADHDRIWIWRLL